MKINFTIVGYPVLFAGALLAASGYVLPAQIKASTQNAHKTLSISGCLVKGDEAGEYVMKTSDGKLYGLTSRHVPLKNHVGHIVVIGGYVVPESSEKPESGATKASTAPSDIDMTVTSLKMVSTSCASK